MSNGEFSFICVQLSHVRIKESRESFDGKVSILADETFLDDNVQVNAGLLQDYRSSCLRCRSYA